LSIDTIPTGIATGTAGSLMASPVTTSVPGLGTFVLPAGCYSTTAMGANCTYQVYDGAAWRDTTVAGELEPFIYSDGTNYRFSNANAAAQNVTYQKIG